jgi:ubiquitin C-terminal hydrolase
MSDYNPLFSDYAQHDAGEALGTLLTMLHKEMNEVPKKEIIKINERLRKDEKYS